MSPTRQESDRACNRPAAIEGHSAEATGRPRIFILSNVRLYREGLAVTLGRTNAVDILGAGAPPDAFARVAELLPEQDVIACAEAGISAFVPREGSTEDLINAVRQAIRGELVCSPRVTALLFDRVAALSAGRIKSIDGHALTAREKEIVSLVERGLSNKEIARRLSVGTATVKNHVHNILEKLHIHRRGEVAGRMHPGWSRL